MHNALLITRVVYDNSGQTNFDVGVTDIQLAADKPPTRLSTAEYHLCGVFVDTLQTHSRVRIPCQSASGRYVFVRRRATVNPMVLCEVEVYVQRECHVVAV